MPIGSPFGAPWCARTARDVLDLVNRVLYIGLQCGTGLDDFAIKLISSVHGQERLHVQIFTPLQKLE
jgi:hypothetical protein